MERSPEYAKVLAGLGQYAHEKVERVLKEMLNELFLATPDDPIQFMINFLTEYKRTRALTSPSARVQGNPIPSPSRSPAANTPQQASPRTIMRAHDRAPSLASLTSVQTSATEEDHNGEANGLPRERSTSSLSHSTSAVIPPDHLDSLPVMEVQGRPNSKAYNRNRRRVGVSAEPVDAMQQSATHTPVVIPKTEEDRAQIRAAVAENILFQGLDDDQMKTVIDAMDRRVFAPGDAVIKQGDDGDHFFVVAKGTADCYVTPKGKPGAQPLLVKQYAYGESFGELALMYNCPRAASIVATSELELWAMDRVTFRRVLMETTSEKRRRYEGFLQQVPLLASLDRYERAKVADALIEITFNDGDCIIAQGDRGNNIYFVKEGTAIATKVLPNSGSQEPQEVMRYGPGSYFGELALLNDLPRAANVIAIGVTKCVYLDRGSFTRLLGPCEEVMKRNTQNYAREEQKVVAQVRARSGSATGSVGTFSASPSTASIGPTALPVLTVSNSMSAASINATTGLSNVPEEPHGGSRRSTGTEPLTPSRSAQSLEAQGGEGGAENSKDSGSGSASAKRSSQSQPAGQSAPPARGRRRAVCAEPVDTHSTAWERVVHPKSAEQAATIRSSIQRNLLFQSLDTEQMGIVVDAMFEKSFAAGETIIRQGDDGDLFYVLHSGVCECFVKKANVPPILVKTYQPGETFGELALMYNCPRAATIIAKTPANVWAMDRVTFHRVLMETTKRKREQYEAFLERVPLLKSLDRYERAKVADALESVNFNAGEYIITAGEVGDCFYILEKGVASARKKLDGDHNGEEQEVMRYDRAGDWFGELALLHNVPRKANVVAEGPVQCARLDRDSFVRLLGPVEEILKRNKQNYADIERRIAEARRSGVTPAPGLTSSASLSCDLDIDDSAK